MGDQSQVYSKSPGPTQPGCPVWVSAVNTGDGLDHCWEEMASSAYIIVGPVTMLAVNIVHVSVIGLKHCK